MKIVMRSTRIVLSRVSRSGNRSRSLRTSSLPGAPPKIVSPPGVGFEQITVRTRERMAGRVYRYCFVISNSSPARTSGFLARLQVVERAFLACYARADAWSAVIFSILAELSRAVHSKTLFYALSDSSKLTGIAVATPLLFDIPGIF